MSGTLFGSDDDWPVRRRRGKPEIETICRTAAARAADGKWYPCDVVSIGGRLQVQCIGGTVSTDAPILIGYRGDGWVEAASIAHTLRQLGYHRATHGPLDGVQS